jgi:hypothetical protein
LDCHRSGEDGFEDLFGIAEILKDCVRLAGREIGDGVSAGGHRYGSGIDALAAGDVRRSVADDDNLRS